MNQALISSLQAQLGSTDAEIDKLKAELAVGNSNFREEASRLADSMQANARACEEYEDRVKTANYGELYTIRTVLEGRQVNLLDRFEASDILQKDSDSPWMSR